MSLFWFKLLQSTTSNIIYLVFILIISSYLNVGLLGGLIRLGSATEIQCPFLFFPIRVTYLANVILFGFITQNKKFGEEQKNINPITTQFCRERNKTNKQRYEKNEKKRERKRANPKRALQCNILLQIERLKKNQLTLQHSVQ
jgi:hypothetical protein